MRTEEPARLDLLRGLEQVLGPERASTLMTYLPHTVDVATREDIRALERRMEERFATVDRRFEAMQRQIDERFEAMQRQIDERFEAVHALVEERHDALHTLLDERHDSLRTLLDERYRGLEHQIKGGNDSTAATLREEMNRLITSQTRTIVFALVGAITANASLVLLAT